MNYLKQKALVTDLGQKLMLQAIADGIKVGIYQFGVGNGKGARYEPVSSMTELKRELWRGAVTSCKINSESPDTLIITAVCPGDVGGFTIREIAVYDNENRMIAISSTPETPKVKITDGVVNELHLELKITLVNGTEVELISNPDIKTAFKKDISELWDYLNDSGRVLVGRDTTPLTENDKCIVVKSIPWIDDRFRQVYIKETNSNLTGVTAVKSNAEKGLKVGYFEQ